MLIFVVIVESNLALSLKIVYPSSDKIQSHWYLTSEIEISTFFQLTNCSWVAYSYTKDKEINSYAI